MIRRFETRDLDEIMDLWLHANIESHSFIEADYWKKNYDMVRKLIPEAEVFVAEENEEIQGFIGLTDTYMQTDDSQFEEKTLRFRRVQIDDTDEYNLTPID